MKKKVKRKKVEVNTVDTRPRKISNLYILLLAVVSVVLFIASIIMFGIIITIPIMVFFAILIALTITLDRYPKNSGKRKLIKSIFILILTLGIIGILSFILFFA